MSADLPADQRPDIEEDSVEASRAPLLSHLTELRSRLIWSFGALVVAALAQLAVTPCASGVTRSIRLRTWDRLIVPLPWCRGVFSVGQGVTPKPRMSESEMADAQAKLTELINAQEAICAAHLRKT